MFQNGKLIVLCVAFSFRLKSTNTSFLNILPSSGFLHRFYGTQWVQLPTQTTKTSFEEKAIGGGSRWWCCGESSKTLTFPILTLGILSLAEDLLPATKPLQYSVQHLHSLWVVLNLKSCSRHRWRFLLFWALPSRRLLPIHPSRTPGEAVLAADRW